MASPQAAATTSILPLTDGTACQVSITRFSSFGFPRSFNKGVPVLGKTYTECAQLVASKRTQYHGFYFDETKSPSVCQPKRFDSLPGANLLMYTPGDVGMVDLGAFGGAAFLQPGHALGQTLGASSKVCGETCRVNPSCAVAVFGGGECVLAGMKPTNLGVSVSFFTREKCGDDKGVWGAVMVDGGGEDKGVAKNDVKVDSEIEKILEGAEGEPPERTEPPPATPDKAPEKSKDAKSVGNAEMRVSEEGATEGFEVAVPEVKGAQPSNQVAAEEKDEMTMDSASDTKKTENASKNQASLNGDDAAAWSVPKIAVVAGIAAALLGLLVAGVCIFVHRKTMKQSSSVSDSNNRGDIESNSAPKKRTFLGRAFTPKAKAKAAPATTTTSAAATANKGSKRSTSMENLDAFRAAAVTASNNQALFVRDASLPTRMNESAVPEPRPSSLEYYSDETRLIDEDGLKRKKARYPNLKINTSRD
ncbi:hypothetical protein CcCBS67573_g09721 [Chytriomyces confervae]|uniref:Uncharacterized protein n=1 Tax=Chytriomyces confervae TaxID=246404 RepID=A0A507DNS8_9FUNG|nr:hypothetical protein CcCBS67573_g09721 [Chytriomyces confervae]